MSLYRYEDQNKAEAYSISLKDGELRNKMRRAVCLVARIKDELEPLSVALMKLDRRQRELAYHVQIVGIIG